MVVPVGHVKLIVPVKPPDARDCHRCHARAARHKRYRIWRYTHAEVSRLHGLARGVRRLPVVVPAVVHLQAVHAGREFFRIANTLIFPAPTVRFCAVMSCAAPPFNESRNSTTPVG